ncbi:MAG: type II toxin-antitoxin system RelE/ParE family toxin [Oscillospiraceae bacterium]|nr:type II toxin-antitoxin system RelE/ParE family toxin [Oscillospiraceae bacterium]
MSCRVEYTDEAKADLEGFNESPRRIIRKLIDRVAENPLPKNEGGYGEPLGNRGGNDLTGLCRIKLLKPGVRVIYKAVRTDGIMKIIVIAARADGEAYALAAARRADK